MHKMNRFVPFRLLFLATLAYNSAALAPPRTTRRVVHRHHLLHAVCQPCQPSATVAPPRPTSDALAAAATTTPLARRLARFASAASLLCVLDCTLLPLAAIALPLFGLAAPASSAALHALGHAIALRVVLPIGGLAAVANYATYRQRRALLGAALGLLCVFVANAPHGCAALALIPSHVAHALHEGPVHRAVNLMGCGALLGANFSSRRLAHKFGACGHRHDQDVDVWQRPKRSVP